MDDFRTALSNLLKAKFAFIYIPTFEEDRALELIHDTAKQAPLIKTPRAVFTWSVTNGFIAEDGSTAKGDTKPPLKALEFIENFAEPAIFILKDFHIYFGAAGRQADNMIVRKLRDITGKLRRCEKPQNVIFISPALELPTELQKEVTILDFDLPDFEEIRSLLREMIEANRATSRIEIDLAPIEEEQLIKSAMGLTIQEAENAFARSMVNDGRLDVRDVETILEEKCQIIKKSGILEYVKSDLSMDDVGGLDNLKRWLTKRNCSWLDAAKAYCLPSPKGVLVTGVPGCGKSLTAKAVGAMWQLPLLRLDVGRVFSGIVGSSEENVRKALKTAEAIAPSILWIDEIEKGFTGTASGGDSGTSARVFATFLTWMQEKTKPVFVIATANNIELLPPEFMRKGRFDEIFFVDLPSRSERMEIFLVHLRKRLKTPKATGDMKITREMLERLTDITEGFSGAEIEQAVISALFEAFAEDRSLTFADLEKTIENTVPLSVTQAEQIFAVREWADTRAVAATSKKERAEYAAFEKKEQSDAAAAKKEDIFSSRGGRAVDF